MDVFGYNMYQFNRSDELAKQMYAQQALGAYTRNVPEAHSMGPPTGMPWNIQGLPWSSPSPPQLVQFTAQPTVQNVPQSSRFTPVVHCKRKSLDVVPEVPAKQLITEEKMAAHLSNLHLSSDYTAHSLGPEEVMDIGIDASKNNFNGILNVRGQKLVLSEEIKKIKDEPLIPASLIERLEKPCMSLVVWQPRESVIDKKLQEQDGIEDETKQGVIIEEITDEDEAPKNRNGVLVPDLSMDVEM